MLFSAHHPSPTSPDQGSRHRKNHLGSLSSPHFYKDDFIPTTIEELEFVRNPFYELSAMHQLKEGEDAQEFISKLTIKHQMTDMMQAKL